MRDDHSLAHSTPAAPSSRGASSATRRLLAAWMTYWSRPLVLVLGLLWVGLLVVPLMFGGSTSEVRQSRPEVEMPRSSIERIERLDTVRQSGRQAEVEGLRLDWLWSKLVPRDATLAENGRTWIANGDPAQLDTLKFVEEFPNLKALKYDNLILIPEDLERLSRCTQLTQLSLSGVSLFDKRTEPEAVGSRLRDLKGDDLGVLTGLQELEVLDLSGLEIAGQLECLSGLPKLHTLILSRFEHLNDAALSELRHLPHLKTLMIAPVYIDRPPTDHEDSVTDAGLRSLAEIPQLRMIHIGFHGPYTVPVSKLRSMLPGVRVRRGFYSEERVMTGGGLPLFICMTAAILLCIHTLNLYAQPMAHLLPRFSPSHQVLPILIQGTSVVGMTMNLLSKEAAFLPSVSLATTWLAGVLWYFHIPTSRVLWRRGIIAVLSLIAFLGFFVAMIGSVFAAVKFPVVVDAFLLGDAGDVVSLALIIVSMLALVQWNRMLPHEAQSFAAAGAKAVLEWKDWKVLTQKSVARQLGSSDACRDPWLFRRSERYLESAVRHPGGGEWSQLQLWRAGVPRVGLSFGVMAVIAGVVATTGWWIELYQSRSFESDLMRGHDLIPGVIFSLMIAGMCLAQWRNRMPGMAGESLRPQTRATLRRLTFLGTLLDMLPPLLVSLGWLILACTYSPPESRTPAMILGMLSIWIVAVLALYAIVMWVLLIDQMWVIVVVLVVSYLVASGVGIGLIAIRHSTDDLELNPTDLMTVAAGLFVVAGLGLVYVWRRWGTVEFGKLDR